MTKLIAWAVPFFMSSLAVAADVKDAPIPAEMNWVGIIAFVLIFFGLSGGFVFMVWRNSRRKPDENKADV